MIIKNEKLVILIKNIGRYIRLNHTIFEAKIFYTHLIFIILSFYLILLQI